MAQDFAKLNHDVCFGKSGGKIIWQPRIGAWFTDRQFAHEPLPAPYTGMNLEQIYRALGCSNRLYDFNDCFKRIEHPAVKVIADRTSDVHTVVIETPVGKQEAVHRHSPNNSGSITLKWEVTTEEEMRVATWREENTTWAWDQQTYERLLREIGDLGAPQMFMWRMNVQSLFIEKMGVENAIYALADWRDTVEAYFRAVDESHERLIDVINASPIDIINFGENLHSDTISPKLFLKYHLPACQRRCEKLHRANKFISSHWDGSCGPLLKYAKETGLDGIEAITPEPQGDVTLEETKEALGDMFLLDGIPAIYFDDDWPIETLEKCARRVIELFAPRLVLGISDEISSTGNLERIKFVGKIVDEYNAQF